MQIGRPIRQLRLQRQTLLGRWTAVIDGADDLKRLVHPVRPQKQPRNLQLQILGRAAVLDLIPSDRERPRDVVGRASDLNKKMVARLEARVAADRLLGMHFSIIGISGFEQQDSQPVMKRCPPRFPFHQHRHGKYRGHQVPAHVRDFRSSQQITDRERVPRIA